MKTKTSSASGFSILKFLLLTVLVLVLAVLAFVTFFLSPTAKWAANRELPKILGTDATVETIKIDVWSGDIEITGVEVADPSAGENDPKLFSLGRVFIDIDTGSLFGDRIIIREITVESPEMNASRGKDGKFSFEALKVMQPSDDEESEPEEPSEGAAFSKAIQIDKVSITNFAASFLDNGDPKGTNQYSIKDFNFLTEKVTFNPGKVVEDLPAGVNLALIQLSDAVIDYQTNRVFKNPDEAPPAEETASKEESPAAPDTQTADASKTTEESSTEAIDPVFVQKFDLNNFSIHYKNTPPDQKNVLDLSFFDVFLTMEDFAYDPANILKKPAGNIVTAKLGLKIQQEGEGISPAQITGVAKSTVIGSGIPITAGALQLTGFELDTIKPLVPTGAQAAIGGPAFDLYAKWFVSPDKLDGLARITSSSDVVTEVEVGGTPDNPKVNGTKALLNIIGRPGAIIGNLAGNALRGSLDVVSGATDAAGNLAKGAGETVAGFGKGLLNTGKGLLTGNLKEAEKGLQEATVGTVKNATNTVNKSAESAVGGVGNAVSSTTGGTRQKDWRVSNSKRHDAFEEGAKDWLENSEFPPTSAELKKDMSAKTDSVEKSLEAEKSDDSQSDSPEASEGKTESSTNQ